VVACVVDAVDELFPWSALPVDWLLAALPLPPFSLSRKWATTLGLAGTTILGAVRCGGRGGGYRGARGSRTIERG
jgi:hypothetical protein